MGRFGRIPSFSFPYYKARLPEHYYKHRQDLKKDSARVHDRAVTGQFMDYKWDEEHKVV